MQATLAVKVYLYGFREAVANVLDLDLEKVQVSNGDTACPDNSHIQVKLVSVLANHHQRAKAAPHANVSHTSEW